MTDASRSNWRSTLSALALGLLLLLPTLAFPLGTDQATFLRGGAAIFNGATLYVDFIDVKPPLVFVLYGLSDLLFGETALGLRLFDLLWQGATILSLIIYIRSFAVERWAPMITAALYAVLYVTLQFSQTTQVETLMGLPMLLALIIYQRPPNWKNNLLIGICFAVMFLLKFTFGIVAAAFAAHVWVTEPSFRRSTMTVVQWFVGTLVGMFIVLLPFLLQPGFLEGWMQTMTFIKIYSGYPPLNMELVRLGLKAIGAFVGDNISIFVISLAIVGGVMSILRTAPDRVRTNHAILTFLFIGLLFTVAVERRFSPYHFSRLYLISALLAGPALAFIWQARKSMFSLDTRMSKALVASAMALAVLFSPLPRYASVSMMSAKSMTDPTVFRTYMTSRTEGPLDLVGFEATRSWIEANTNSGSQVMLMSISAAMLAPFIPEQTPSAFADSHIYFAVGAHEQWKQKALQEMQRADFLVVDTADVHPLVTLHEYSSYECIQQDVRFARILDTQFTLDTTINTLRIYRHHSNTP